jgi:hypothetical protein
MLAGTREWPAVGRSLSGARLRETDKRRRPNVALFLI